MAKTKKDAIKEWLNLLDTISVQTQDVAEETPKQKAVRVERLKNNFREFVKYYFPHYVSSDSPDFHIDAGENISIDDNAFAVLEWAREHAKSVVSNIFIPMFLKSRGQMKMMVLASKSKDSAEILLSDIAAELANNKRYINDYGTQISSAVFAVEEFTDATGVRYKALGRGQSPRGLRNKQYRPDYIVVDDIDDDVLVRNEHLTAKATEWVLGALYGALDIRKGRFVMCGNRIAQKSILARVVGDYEPGLPVKEGIYHSKICAIDPKTGQPSWKEKFTLEMLKQREQRLGSALYRREYFHEPIRTGEVFKYEWMRVTQALPFKDYDALCYYIDPSFSSKNTADYKAIVLIGRKGSDYHLLRAWVRQGASISAMVRYIYDEYKELKDYNVQWWMESTFSQSMLLNEFEEEGKKRGYYVPLRGDMRQKPAKDARIINLQPFFENNKFWFTNFGDADQIKTREQFLDFGSNGNDDAPDAVEGCINKMQRESIDRSTTWLKGAVNRLSKW